jgi:hypothetical protein
MKGVPDNCTKVMVCELVEREQFILVVKSKSGLDMMLLGRDLISSVILHRY